MWGGVSLGSCQILGQTGYPLLRWGLGKVRQKPQFGPGSLWCRWLLWLGSGALEREGGGWVTREERQAGGAGEVS